MDEMLCVYEDGNALLEIPGKDVQIRLALSEDGETYDYMVLINDMPCGGGVISNEGLGEVKTAEKIYKMAHIERIARRSF